MNITIPTAFFYIILTFARAIVKQNITFAPYYVDMGYTVFSTLVILPFVALNYHPMTLRQTICLICTGLCSGIAQIFVTNTYHYAPVNEISIYDYMQVLFAMLWGAILFDEFPEPVGILGYVLIIGSAFARWHHKRHQGN